jgi:hypothetical protein
VKGEKDQKEKNQTKNLSQTKNETPNKTTINKPEDQSVLGSEYTKIRRLEESKRVDATLLHIEKMRIESEYHSKMNIFSTLLTNKDNYICYLTEEKNFLNEKYIGETKFLKERLREIIQENLESKIKKQHLLEENNLLNKENSDYSSFIEEISKNTSCNQNENLFDKESLILEKNSILVKYIESVKKNDELENEILVNIF